MKIRKQIGISDKDQKLQQVWLEIEEEEITLTLPHLGCSKTADNYFNALCELRLELEKKEIVLMCNGSSRDVYPSAMMLDMGDADSGYRLKLGLPATMKDIVNLFDFDEAHHIACTVRQQEEFYKEWVNSRSK